MNRLLFLLAVLLVPVTVGIGGGVAAASPAPAALFASTIKDDLCTGAGVLSAEENATFTCGDKGVAVTNAVKVVINILSGIIGLIAVIMIIIAGARFITSGGDANKVAGAKNAVVYAIIGLVIVAFSQFIVHFVLNTVQANSQASQSQNSNGAEPVTSHSGTQP